MTDIAVIGAGRIGSTLATAWHRSGHRVVLGVRRPPAEPKPGVATAEIGDAIARATEAGGVVVLAVPGAAVPALISSHRAHLAGALVVDASNSVGAGSMHHADAAADVPDLRYARAFNTVGVEVLAAPVIDGQRADLFFAAPADDRPLVASLIEDVGLRPVFVGEGSAAADVLDGVTRLWFALAMGPTAHAEGRTRHLGFRMLP